MGEELEIIKQNKDLIKNLYEFIKKNKGFQEEATITFLINPKNATEPLGRTAYYSPEEKKVAIYVVGRHIKDILRSIAHELIHHSQYCRGEFNNISQTNEGYAQNDEHLRNMEKEAYLDGNMLFRDFEDQLKTQKV